MLTIQLTEQQKKNLLVFLGRVQLAGQEAKVFTGIINAIENATVVIQEAESRGSDS